MSVYLLLQHEMINEPLIVGEWRGDNYHQTSVDQMSDHARAMQSAHKTGVSAEIFGTMRQPSVERDEASRFWERFKQELRDAGVGYAFGWVKHHLARHHVEAYGMHLTGKTMQHKMLGELVEVAIDLTKEIA